MMDVSLKDRDLEIANGDFVMCSDEGHAIAQSISIRLKTLAGEWFLDTRVGIPYLSHIIGKKNSERLLHKLISQELRNLPSEVIIKDLVIEADRAERSLTVSFNAVLSDKNVIAITEPIGAL